jgi:signal recognition particle GTPase
MGIPDLARKLAEQLSGWELNSLLMAVFEQRVREAAPQRLLRQYQANRVKLQRREGYIDPDGLLQAVFQHLQAEEVSEIVIDKTAGLTDWTQQLMENRKERLLVCGFGLEWLYKLI